VIENKVIRYQMYITGSKRNLFIGSCEDGYKPADSIKSHNILDTLRLSSSVFQRRVCKRNYLVRQPVACDKSIDLVLGLFRDAVSTAHTAICCVGLMGRKQMGTKEDLSDCSSVHE
jgi:hypothetical protein